MICRGQCLKDAGLFMFLFIDNGLGERMKPFRSAPHTVPRPPRAGAAAVAVSRTADAVRHAPTRSARAPEAPDSLVPPPPPPPTIEEQEEHVEDEKGALPWSKAAAKPPDPGRSFASFAFDSAARRASRALTRSRAAPSRRPITDTATTSPIARTTAHNASTVAVTATPSADSTASLGSSLVASTRPPISLPTGS